MAFTLRRRIDAPVADVFAYLADATNTPRWYEAVRDARPLQDGPVAVGARYRMVRRLPGGTAANVIEIAELEQDAVVTLASVDGPTPFRYRYELRPAARGGTDLRLDGEIRGDGLQGPAALLAPLAGRLFANGMAANLTTLKRILEAP